MCVHEDRSVLTSPRAAAEQQQQTQLPVTHDGLQASSTLTQQHLCSAFMKTLLLSRSEVKVQLCLVVSSLRIKV